MTDYEVIAYRPEFKDQVVALYGDAFRLAPLECRRYLEWKHERNPYIREPTLFVARDGHGSILGMRGFYGTCWKVAGQRIVIPCADDFAIVPGERNKGLMTGIMRAAIEALAQRGYSQLLNASGGMVTVLQSLAMGWQSLGPMEAVARLSPRERIRRTLRKLAEGKPFVWRFAREKAHGDAACFVRLDRSGRRSASRGGSVVVGSLPRPEAMAQLVDRRPDDGRIGHVRDAAFFRWRFDNPAREYRFLYHERDGDLAGFLIVGRSRSYRPNKPPFNIVDWEARTENVRAELLDMALAWGRFPLIGTWSASLSSSGRKMLTDHGFHPTDLDLRARGMPCVLLKNLGTPGSPAAAVDGAAWDVRLIDSMHG